jgi:hypothetical protein
VSGSKRERTLQVRERLGELARLQQAGAEIRLEVRVVRALGERGAIVRDRLGASLPRNQRVAEIVVRVCVTGFEREGALERGDRRVAPAERGEREPAAHVGVGERGVAREHRIAEREGALGLCGLAQRVGEPAARLREVGPRSDGALELGERFARAARASAGPTM